VALAAFVALGAAACGNRGAAPANNANNTNAGANANRAAADNTNYNSGAGGAASQSDTALKNTVQANMTKAGVSGVEVEVAEGVVTLKGNVPRAKMQDAVKAANDAGPKRVLNQLNAQ